MGKTTEAREQRSLVAYLRNRSLIFWHTPNQLAARTRRKGAINKALGVVAGVPDIVIASPVHRRPEVRGVGIEMKGPGGKLSDAQRRMAVVLQSCGWLTYVCWSAEEAKAVVRDLWPEDLDGQDPGV